MLLFIFKRQNCANDVFILLLKIKIDIQFLKKKKRLEGIFLSVHPNVEESNHNLHLQIIINVF